MAFRYEIPLKRVTATVAAKAVWPMPLAQSPPIPRREGRTEPKSLQGVGRFTAIAYTVTGH